VAISKHQELGLILVIQWLRSRLHKLAFVSSFRDLFLSAVIPCLCGFTLSSQDGFQRAVGVQIYLPVEQDMKCFILQHFATADLLLFRIFSISGLCGFYG